MTSTHPFIFIPGHWIGQGKLTFSASPTHIRIYMKWMIDKIENGMIHATQQIEQEGDMEHLFNTLHFSSITPHTFDVNLSNNLLESVNGHGIIDEKKVAWEYRVQRQGDQRFEGFEVYELQENGDYMLHAEYLTDDQFRTIIDGRIWRK